MHVEIEAADTVAPLRRRMFHYYEPLRRRYDLPVLPIGVYLHVGLEGVGWDCYAESFWEKPLIRFYYAYIGLPALDAEQYVRQDNLLGVALSALMHVPKERRIALANEALVRIVHSPENSYRKTLLCECVSAYLPTDEEQQRQFEDMVRNHPDPGVQAMQIGFFDHVEQRGELKGQREMLREVLEGRFGRLPTAVIARLAACPADRLRELGRGLFSANSIEELGLSDAEPGGPTV